MKNHTTKIDYPRLSQSKNRDYQSDFNLDFVSLKFDENQYFFSLGSFTRFHSITDDSFYIILQGSVNIYRLEDEAVKPGPLPFDPVKEFAKLDVDPEKREEMIAEAFGNYIVTLGKNHESIISC